MAGQWQPGDTVPDRWLLALEAGEVSLDDTATALAAHDWPDATPGSSGNDPFPAGGWVRTMDAAHADGRISDEQYRAIYEACR